MVEEGERDREYVMKTDFSLTRQVVRMMLTRAALYRCINSSDLYILQRLKHKGHEVEASLGYLGRSCLK